MKKQITITINKAGIITKENPNGDAIIDYNSEGINLLEEIQLLSGVLQGRINQFAQAAISAPKNLSKES